MKVTTSTFLKHKTYLFSFIAIMLANMLCSSSAYSQVDYFYGLNNTGFRLGLGVGGASLKSNWTQNAVKPVGVVLLDYDFNQFVGIGLQGQFGSLAGEDHKQEFSYEKTDVTFASGNLNIHVAVGEFLSKGKQPQNLLTDALQKIYVGVGIGAVYSNATLYNRYDGAIVVNPYSKFIQPHMKSADGGTAIQGNGSFAIVPINLGTRIPLRGLFGNDKVDLNPNFQYTFVQSAVFDGYQPSSVDAPTLFIKKNGNQAYADFTLSIRYKF